jgi:autotransporter-associated beta strand protein
LNSDAQDHGLEHGYDEFKQQKRRSHIMMLNMIKTTQRAVLRAAFAAAFFILGLTNYVLAQTWTPADLSNLALWLDGSDTNTLFLDTGATQAITNNGAIARWNDKSVNGRNFTQGTLGNRPTLTTNSINGLSAATFNGSAGFMSAGDTLDMRTNSLTVMSVVKYNTGTDSGVIIGKTSYRGQEGRWVLYRCLSDGGLGSGTQYNMVLQQGVLPGSVLKVADSSTSAKINGFVLDRSTSGSCKIWDNGTNTASATFTGNTTDFNSPDELWIGAYQSASGTTPPTAGSYLNGKIAEIVVASTNLPTSDRQKLEGYLAWKWGMEANLPADHPYKSAAPSSALQATVTAPANGQQFLSGSSVTGTVTVAGGTMPYAVTFYTNGFSAWSTNNASTNLFTIPLGALADGTYTNYAMVVDNAGTPVTASSATNTFTVAPDTTAPTPNPMTFAVAPWAMDNSTMIMTATTATDALTPPVYYYFENTTNSDTSGWTTSTVWTNTGLTLGTTYGYQVKARDSATPTPNETGFSGVFNAAPANRTLYWDITPGTVGAGNGTVTGGSETWNTSNGNWTLDGGTNNIAWNNANNDTALFGGTAGTVTNMGVTVGGLIFTAAYTLTSNTVTFGSAGSISNTAAVTISSILAGTGPITKDGSGALTLSGANTYSGGTVINAGTVNIGADNNLGNSAGGITFNGSASLNHTATFSTTRSITLNNNAVVTFPSGIGQTLTISGPVTGNGGVFVTSYENLTLSSAGNNFTGPVWIGYTSLGNIGGNGTRLTVNSIGDGASPVTFGYANTAPGQGHDQAFIWNGSSDLVLNNRYFQFGPVANPSVYGSGMIENANAGSANTITINTDLVVSGTGSGISKYLTLRGVNTGTNTFAGKIVDGTGTPIALIKDNAGTWVLSGNNTYSGTTLLSAGTLKANGANALGASNVTVTAGTLQIDAANALADTATLRLPSATGVNLVMNANDTVGALYLNGVQQPNGIYTRSGLGSGWMTGTGTLTVGSATAYWDLDGATAGAGGATPAGTWNAANTYWNDAAGTGIAVAWTPGQTAAFAAGTNAIGTYTVTVDGTQDIGGLTFEEGNVTLSGGTALRLVSDTLAFVAANRTGTVATAISQDVAGRALTKGGAGTLTLATDNTYAGGTTISAGTLQVGNGGATGSLGSGLVANSGALIFNRTASVTNGTISGAGALRQSGSGTVVFGGADTSTGTITVDGGCTLDLNGYAGTHSQVLGSGTVTNSGGACTLVINGAGYTCSNVFSGAGLSMRFGTSSAVTLTTNSTYGGSTQVSKYGGILKLGVHNALPVGGPVMVDGDWFCLLDLNGFNQTVGRLSLGSSGGGWRGIVTNSTGTSTLTLTNGVFCDNHNAGGGGIYCSYVDLNGTNQTFTVWNGSAVPDLLISSVIQNGGLIMSGASADLGLSGPNTYYGPTLVSAGVLQLGNLLALQNSPLDTSGAGTVSLNAGTNAYTLGGLNGNRNLSLVITGNPASLTNLVLNTGAGVTNTYSGIIDNRSTGMNLTKTGAGTQILSGTNTYSGKTTVSAGVLDVRNTATLTASSGLQIDYDTATLRLENADNGGSVWTRAALLALEPNATAGADGPATDLRFTANGAYTDITASKPKGTLISFF